MECVSGVRESGGVCEWCEGGGVCEWCEGDGVCEWCEGEEWSV